ncbi:MAG: HAD family hydrolase [Roseburia sp.]
MKRYETVIFDLDGTLLDTLDDLMDAVNYSLKQCGMPMRSREEIRQFVGNGIQLLMERSVPGGKDNPRFEQSFALFKEYYGVHCNDKTCLYPGVGELLEELKRRGMRLAIVSNKADFAVKELKDIYFGEVVDVAMGEREDVKRKPAPDMVQCVQRELDVPKETCIYVGDSDVDIETAHNAGIPCISVTWGFRDREFLTAHGATAFAQDTRELLEQLLG